MKIHLFRPGEQLTMCGIQIKAFSVRDPERVTCKKCQAAYLGNEDWYEHVTALLAGPAGKYSVVDTPMFGPSSVTFPNLPFDWRPFIEEWTTIYQERYARRSLRSNHR